MLTEAQLRQIMPNLPAAKAALFLPHLNRAMAEYGIDSMLRTAAFIAQLAHESGEFRWMEEIWGPTDAQRRYEPVTDLSKRLGNTEPGDGKRFKGRGPIQLTGRTNYQRFGGLLGIDLVGGPEQAAAPEAAFRVAALYWKNRGLNELADAQDFREITRRINGGFNGLADRQKYFDRAKDALATGFQAGAPVATRGVMEEAIAQPREVPAEPLTRGFEAIRELRAPTKRAKKPAARKPTTKKVTGKKAPAKKPSTKKGVKKKAPAKKPAIKKAVARKTTKKPSATKTGKKKPAARKKPAKKVTATPRTSTNPTKKASGKRPAARKPATKKAAASRPLVRRR